MHYTSLSRKPQSLIVYVPAMIACGASVIVSPTFEFKLYHRSN
ncbi:MAG TPA: hypothetical protein VGI40_08705 [Pirellulaceae bacterium]